MTVVVGQRTVSVHDKVLGAQKVLQILRMVPDDLCDMVQLYPFHVVRVEYVLERDREREKYIKMPFILHFVMSIKAP